VLLAKVPPGLLSREPYDAGTIQKEVGSMTLQVDDREYSYPTFALTTWVPSNSKGGPYPYSGAFWGPYWGTYWGPPQSVPWPGNDDDTDE